MGCLGGGALMAETDWNVLWCSVHHAVCHIPEGIRETEWRCDVWVVSGFSGFALSEPCRIHVGSVTVQGKV
jgi:hypothetical protein